MTARAELGEAPSFPAVRAGLVGPRPGRRRRAAVLVLVVSAVLILPPLWYPAVLNTSHDARFALLARDMLTRHTWFGAERGVLYRNKPPLYPWSIAGVGMLRGGVTEAVALVPVALAALTAVLFTFLLGDGLFDRRAGVWAALILATSYSFFAFSQRPLPDMLVVAFGAMAGYAFWQAIEHPPGRGARLGFYGALAGGVFAKGPVGLIPLLVAVVWLSVHEGIRGLRRLWSLGGLGLFAAVTAGWGVPMLMAGAEALGDDVVKPELFSYFGAPNLVSLGGQVSQGLLGFLPWTILAPLAFGAAVRARKSHAVSFALLWFAVPLVMIFASHIQRTRYLLPIYPGAALVVAWWVDRHGTDRSALRRGLGILGVASAVAVLAAPLWAKPSARSFVPGYSWASLPVLVGVAVVGAALGWGLWHGRPALLVAGVTAGMILVLSAGTRLHHRWLNATQDFPGFAARVDRYARGREVGLFLSRDAFVQLDFYLGRSPTPLGTAPELVRYLERSDHPVVVIERPRWVAMGIESTTPARVLANVRVGNLELLIVRVPAPGEPASPGPDSPSG